MRRNYIVTSNVTRLNVVYQGLRLRDPGVPGMGLVHGFTGSGKTTALTWLSNKYNALYVRANATWTASAMVRAIAGELGIVPGHSTSKNYEAVKARLNETGRSLVIDEADYLLKDLKAVEIVRDLHDETSVPILLVGMSGHDAQGIERQITSRPRFKQLARRILHWVEFGAISLDDARNLALENSEVEVADDLLEWALAQCTGSIGLMTVALSRIEGVARANGLPRIDLETWGDRALHLGDRGGVR